MLQTFKPDHPQTSVADPEDITLGALLDVLDAHPSQPLLFLREGRPLKPGYHVTEVKAGRIATLDCGSNLEAWSETVVQLWDAGDSEAGRMGAGKFAAIICTVAGRLPLDLSAKLTFEVSDGVEPLRLYRAHTPEIVEGGVRVALSGRPASCKPRDRWLSGRHHASAGGRCGASSRQPCCG